MLKKTEPKFVRNLCKECGGNIEVYTHLDSRPDYLQCEDCDRVIEVEFEERVYKW